MRLVGARSGVAQEVVAPHQQSRCLGIGNIAHRECVLAGLVGYLDEGELDPGIGDPRPLDCAGAAATGLVLIMRNVDPLTRRHALLP